MLNSESCCPLFYKQWKQSMKDWEGATKDVAWLQQGCSMTAARMQHGCSKDAEWLQQGCGMAAARMWRGCSKDAAWLQQGCSVAAARMRHGCSKDAEWLQQRCGMAAATMRHGCSLGCNMAALGMQGWKKDVSFTYFGLHASPFQPFFILMNSYIVMCCCIHISSFLHPYSGILLASKIHPLYFD